MTLLARRRVAGALTGLLAAPTALLLTAPAHAADLTEPAIVQLSRTPAGLQVVVDVPADVTPDLAGVGATVDGTDYPATAARIADGDTTVQRTTVLAIDTSASMEGERFAAAQEAARAYLDAVPADVAVGIVSFDSAVRTDLEPTLDRDAARAVIDDLTLARRTELYEGVLEAVAVASGGDGTTADGGQAQVLLLSDGADTGRLRVADVAASIAASGVRLDVVGLEQSAADLRTLERLAGEEGRVVNADPEALAAAFSQEASVLARQVAVTIEAPAEVVAGQVSVALTLPSSGGDLRLASTLPAADGAPAPAPAPITAATASGPGIDLPGWVNYAGVAVFALGLVLAVMALVPRRPEPLSVEERVVTYSQLGRSTAPVVPGGGVPDAAKPEPALAQATEAAAQVLRRNRGLEEGITRRLAAAGSELKASEWLLVHTGAFVAITLLGLLIGGGRPVIAVLFVVLGALGPWLYLGMRGSRRRKRFDSLLPETLQMMASSLSAGLSLAQSVDTIVREGAEPVRTEFRRVLVETRLGVSLEDALEGVATRFDSRDFRWVVMAIRIQRQVGGNLAELLHTVAATMREREYMRRQVNALAAEGKLSAIVLGGLPPLFLLYLMLTRYDYVEPLFTEPLGIVMLTGASLWLGIGIFWMSRLVKVEV